jgi:hypothetical protein
LNELGGSLDKIVGPSEREGSSERRTVGGRSDSLIESLSAIDSPSLLRIDGSGDGNGSGSLNETGGFGVDVVNGTESSGSGADSVRADSNFLASSEPASGLENPAGELDDEVPMANFHAPSNMVFHENGAVKVESAADGAETSGSGSTAAPTGGSTVRIDSLVSGTGPAGAR